MAIRAKQALLIDQHSSCGTGTTFSLKDEMWRTSEILASSSFNVVAKPAVASKTRQIRGGGTKETVRDLA